MPRKRRHNWVESRALIQRGSAEYLITRANDDEDGPWEFPGGRINTGESPEAALRRICRATLRVEIKIAVGQPPFVHSFGTHSVTYRYYLCRADADDPAGTGCEELRWVRTQQLRDYVFDAPAQQVVDWLVGET